MSNPTTTKRLVIPVIVFGSLFLFFIISSRYEEPAPTSLVTPMECPTQKDCSELECPQCTGCVLEASAVDGPMEDIHTSPKSFVRCTEWVRRPEFAWNRVPNDWNFGGAAYRRFDALPFATDSKSIIFEIGGNRGDDTRDFLTKYNCEYHVFEPIPSFWPKLKPFYDKYPGFHLYEFGLAAKTENLSINSGLDMAANIFEMGTELVSIKRASSWFKSSPLNNVEIDLLTSNCEGCEFPVLEDLLEGYNVSKFKVIQMGTHNYPEMKDTMARYCRLQQMLRLTHVRVWGYPGAWERWVRKDFV